MDRIRQEVKRASRYGTHVSLLMMDLDHFKIVNDTHGHQAGDTVLSGVAARVKESIREIDLFARYGGEEFCLIATAMDRGEAFLLADRLRGLIEQERFSHNGKEIRVTLSIGVGSWEPSFRENFEELIKQADDALYRAKEQGRNRVCN